jgi:hypothetical protein
MPKKITENYKGREINVEIPDDPSEKTKLFIDDKHIHVMSSKDQYSSHYIPYADFKNPVELAKVIIDNVSGFGVSKKEN